MSQQGGQRWPIQEVEHIGKCCHWPEPVWSKHENTSCSKLNELNEGIEEHELREREGLKDNVLSFIILGMPKTMQVKLKQANNVCPEEHVI